MGVGIFCALLAGALWGSIFIAPKMLSGFSPWEIALGRYAIYGLLAFLLVIAPRVKRLLSLLTADDLRVIVRQSLTGNVIYFILLSYAVQNAGVAAASLIIGMLPVVVTLMGRRDHGAVGLRALAVPMLMIAAGIVCINVELFRHDQAVGGAVTDKLVGVACAIGAVLCWGYYAIDNARYLKRSHKFTSTEWSALYGFGSGLISLLIIPVCYGAFDLFNLQSPSHDWSLFLIVIGVMALGPSMLGNQLWNVTSRRVPVTLSGQMMVFETLFGLLYGFCYDQRWPGGLEWLAIVLLIGGVSMAVRRHGPTTI